MAVKLRLMRMGKKKQPTYRVVAADSRSPRDGRFIEIVGTYQPRQDPSVISIDNDKAVAWLQKGAQPTERVEKLLKISGAWEAFTGATPDVPPVPEPTPNKGYTPPSPAKPKAEAAPAAEEAPAEEVAADDSEATDDETPAPAEADGPEAEGAAEETAS
ncbi:MAG: 30S ribosomal protein S16 [Acidimicrobiales bacterium]